ELPVVLSVEMPEETPLPLRLVRILFDEVKPAIRPEKELEIKLQFAVMPFGGKAKEVAKMMLEEVIASRKTGPRSSVDWLWKGQLGNVDCASLPNRF
ncbi:hypothetical protein PENTCL1PPCAC_12052, partial [Pristionchus entomophagus]